MSPAILLAVLALAQEDPTIWERDALLGDLGSLRPDLAEQGITFTLAYTGEVLSNVRGGIDTGSEYAGLLDLVLDPDLSKALGWNGGSVRLNPMWIEGQGMTRDYVGDLTRVSNIDGRDEVRLFEVWVQQAVLEGELSLRGVSGDYDGAQPDPSSWDREIAIEATYRIVLSRWWSLQPDFQVVIHPGGSDEIDDAFVIGMRLDLLF